MESIKLLVKGFIIGIGKIIPGVSGAMFAMMFGVYEKAVKIISNPRKLKGNLKFMFLLGISILIAILCGSSIINYSLDKYYLCTMLFFIGMMASGIKPLFKNLEDKKVTTTNILWAIFVVVILAIMSCIDMEGITKTLDRSFVTVILIFLSGIIDAIGTVIPGVCGTALLMMVGYYDKVISSLSNLLIFKNMSETSFVLIPFVIGLCLGILLVSKLVTYLFKKYNTTVHCSIIGFAISSTIILVVKAFMVPFETNELIIGMILFIVGYIFTYFLDFISFSCFGHFVLHVSFLLSAYNVLEVLLPFPLQ